MTNLAAGAPVRDFAISAPARRVLLALALGFSSLLTLLASLVVSRVLEVAGGGQTLTLSIVLVIGAVALLCMSLVALLVFQRLQLPLETAELVLEDQRFRLDQLDAELIEARSSRTFETENRIAAEQARQERDALATKVTRLEAELARSERALAAIPRPRVDESVSAAHRDPLTGLASGMARFEARVDELAESARRSGSFHGLLLIGVDDLGKVHDQFGAAAGEENLWQIVQQMREHMPHDGELLRLSTKHFAMLLPERSDSACLEIAHSLCTDVSGRDFAWEGQPLRSNLSIGVVSIGLADLSASSVIERAEHALRLASALGGAHVHKESLLPMLEGRAREQSLTDWLKDKLKSKQLRLAAQPIMPAGLTANAPSWVELLLRIEDDDGVWLTPEHYIDVIERMHLTPLIDKWVIETALKAGPRCANLAATGGKLSINIFGSSLLRDGFVAQVRDVLSHSALPTQQIVFELDEAFVVQHSSRVAAFVTAVSEFGCQLALDRYRGGVGLSALRHFPAQYIKLHESLVQRQITDVIDRAHIDWLVTSAHLAGAKVVACAVRDAATFDRLRECGVDYVQGFAIAVPSPYAL